MKTNGAGPAGVEKGAGLTDSRFFIPFSLRRGLEDEAFERPLAQHPWYYSIVRQVWLNLAGTPFQLRRGSREDPEIVEEGPVWQVFRDVNPLMSRSQLWEAVAVHMWTAGGCGIVKEGMNGERWKRGTVPAALWPFPARAFKPQLSVDTKLPELYRLSVQGMTNVEYQPDEVIFFRLFNPYDFFAGLGPMEPAAISARTDFKATVWNEKFFDNGAVPGGVITSPGMMTREEAKQALDMFEDRHRGYRRGHRVSVLGGGLDFRETPSTHRDMEYRQQKEWSRDEMFGAGGVPKLLGGVTDDYNRATAESAKAIFFENTMIPLMSYLEEILEKELPTWGGEARNMWAEWDLTAVKALRKSQKEKLESAKLLRDLGYPINLINEQLDLGMPAVEHGDIPLLFYLLAPAEDVAGGDVLSNIFGQEEEEVGQGELEDDLAEESKPEITASMSGFDHAERWKQSIDSIFRLAESRFRGRYRRYVFEQRNAVLRDYEKLIADRLGPAEEAASMRESVRKDDRVPDLGIAQIDALLPDKRRWDGELRKRFRPLYRDVASQTLRDLANDIPGGLSVVTAENPEILRKLLEKEILVTRVNDHLREQLRQTLTNAARERATVSQISAQIKLNYQFAQSRSLTIARTETAQASSAVRHEAMRQEGITQHRWISARDARVRLSHAAQDGDVVTVGEKFKNGLRHPSELGGSADEVVNCRCIVVPVVEG